MRKAAIFILALLIAVSTYAPGKASAATALGKELQAVVDLKIMQGNEKGDLMPKKSVTRGEFATFISRALKLPQGSGSFPDVAPSSKLAAGIYNANKAGIVTGYSNGNFGPNDKISREQMAVMIGRALTYKKVEKIADPINFTDNNQFTSSEFKREVMVNVHYKIINGIPNAEKPGTFRFEPKNDATREQAAAVIYRMLNAVNGQYKVASIQSGTIKESGQSFKTFAEAEQAITDSNNQVILVNGAVYKMKSGLVVPKNTAIIYDKDLKTQLTYVSDEAELNYIDADENSVKVEFAGKTGYVKHEEINLHPAQLVENRSFYKVEDGQLYHYVFKQSSRFYDPFIIGKAPSFLSEGNKYYSQDGSKFMDAAGNIAGTGYQYFSVLPLRTSTNYTADELNQFVESKQPGSPLAELGAEFKAAEAKYRVNALFMLSHAIIESQYGTSLIAKNKNNIFGIKAYDGNAFGEALSFDSLSDCVEFYAKMINDSYINPDSSYAKGAILGNKARGMNVHYAGDAYWGEKIAGMMYQIDTESGRKDFGDYRVAASTTDFINVRKSSNTQLAAQFTYHYQGAPFVILDEIPEYDGIWYKTLSDSPDYTVAYIRSDNAKELQIVK
ncbi:S-layer homology domain-containing protein [Falsibacillus pallidus]|uniref:Beta-N-acetylglucosaminidase n=1 Tax=Falsibacillus pallidus TaxID=493781 RepID=A0A370GCH8_9BACI|nr:S-layer homology domain-containing protein [Falsibacillus pallidus]RDI40164.1 beta-N-acetylglucosaminidase [Falsibacillus pallidus]